MQRIAGKLLSGAAGLLLLLVAPIVAGHSGDGDRYYVSSDGRNAGHCDSAAAPCQTIAYALQFAGKHGKVFVGAGSYEVSSSEELIQIVTGLVEIRGGFVAPADRELHEAAGIAIHRRLAQLFGIHLAQTLEASDSHLAFLFLGLDAIEDACTFALVERIEDFLANVDAVQRWHRDINVSIKNEFAEVPQEQRTQQCGDVQAVRVGISEDADLVIAQAAQIVTTRINAERDRDIVHFL